MVWVQGHQAEETELCAAPHNSRCLFQPLVQVHQTPVIHLSFVWFRLRSPKCSSGNRVDSRSMLRPVATWNEHFALLGWLVPGRGSPTRRGCDRCAHRDETCSFFFNNLNTDARDILMDTYHVTPGVTPMSPHVTRKKGPFWGFGDSWFSSYRVASSPVHLPRSPS